MCARSRLKYFSELRQFCRCRIKYFFALRRHTAAGGKTCARDENARAGPPPLFGDDSFSAKLQSPSNSGEVPRFVTIITTWTYGLCGISATFVPGALVPPQPQLLLLPAPYTAGAPGSTAEHPLHAPQGWTLNDLVAHCRNDEEMVGCCLDRLEISKGSARECNAVRMVAPWKSAMGKCVGGDCMGGA